MFQDRTCYLSENNFFLLNAIFNENGGFASEMIVMSRKWLFCRRVKDILQRLPRLVLSMEVAAVAKRWILFWKRNFEKKSLYSHIWRIWFWNNSFKGKGFNLTRTVCISFITCLLFYHTIMMMITIMMTFIVSLQITLSGVQAMHFEVIRLHACDRWASSRQWWW